MTEFAQDDGSTQGHFPWRILWILPVILLAVPFVAMRFTAEVNWTLGDFIFAGTMFGLVGLCLELVFRKTRNWTHRLAVIAAVATSFLVIWIAGAVGIIGASEQGDGNILYLGVVLTALLGSVVALFRPAGMAKAMIAAAIAQLAVPAIVYLTAMAPPLVFHESKMYVLNGFFAGMWLISALLFRRATA